MTRLGCLNGREILEGYDENMTFGEAAEKHIEYFNEIAPLLAQGFSAFRSATAGKGTHIKVD